MREFVVLSFTTFMLSCVNDPNSFDEKTNHMSASNDNNSTILAEDTTFYFADSVDIGLFNAFERKDKRYIEKFILALDTVQNFQSFMQKTHIFSERIIAWGLISPDPKSGLFCENCNDEIVRKNYLVGFRLFFESCLLFGDSSCDNFIRRISEKYFSFDKLVSENELGSIKNEINKFCQR